jgi:hypothetical protein
VVGIARRTALIISPIYRSHNGAWRVVETWSASTFLVRESSTRLKGKKRETTGHKPYDTWNDLLTEVEYTRKTDAGG